MHGSATHSRRHHTATPYLVARDAAKAIDFHKRAFGAIELGGLADAGRRIVHAEKDRELAPDFSIVQGSSPSAVPTQWAKIGV